MAYNELIKNFSLIRDYLREFYVYGFKSRNEYDKKSSRTYDDERRRLESWLGDYMRFRQTPDGKNVFLSIDSRVSIHNPLYAAWKTKSFTDGDITLHFILFDILSSPDKILSLKEIMEEIDTYLSEFEESKMFDESTVRKKIKEYVKDGLVAAEKQGKVMYYHRAQDDMVCNMVSLKDMLDYFSEISPCGVIGSFLLDKTTEQSSCFAFKHHYITSAMDSEVLVSLFEAMFEKRYVAVEIIGRHKKKFYDKIVPLRVMISVQNGRQYLLTFSADLNRITTYRIDNIVSVKEESVCEKFDEFRRMLDEMQKNMWGINTPRSSDQSIEHVEFTVRYRDDEQHIHKRLEREKRCGNVEKLDKNTSRFTADVWDANEMIPWIRTFICRIIDIRFTNKKLEKNFKNDIRQMYALYGLESGDAE